MPYTYTNIVLHIGLLFYVYQCTHLYTKCTLYTSHCHINIYTRGLSIPDATRETSRHNKQILHGRAPYPLAPLYPACILDNNKRLQQILFPSP